MYLLIASLVGEENGVAQFLRFFDTFEVFVRTYQVIYESLAFYWVSTAISVCLYSSVTDTI
jgi:hypothetical protein